jgi:hypothetical protein
MEEGKMKAVEMEMQDVEILRVFSNLGEHGEMGWNVPRQVAVEP